MDKLEATNDNIWVVRDEPETEKGGFIIPDSAIQKATTGMIITVGGEVTDKRIKPGRTAVFTKQIGQDLVYKGETYVILAQHQIRGVE